MQFNVSGLTRTTWPHRGWHEKTQIAVEVENCANTQLRELIARETQNGIFESNSLVGAPRPKKEIAEFAQITGFVCLLPLVVVSVCDDTVQVSQCGACHKNISLGEVFDIAVLSHFCSLLVSFTCKQELGVRSTRHWSVSLPLQPPIPSGCKGYYHSGHSLVRP